MTRKDPSAEAGWADRAKPRERRASRALFFMTGAGDRAFAVALVATPVLPVAMLWWIRQKLR